MWGWSTVARKPIPLNVEHVTGGPFTGTFALVRTQRRGDEHEVRAQLAVPASKLAETLGLEDVRELAHVLNVALYVSHFATCPNADQHRSARPAR